MSFSIGSALASAGSKVGEFLGSNLGKVVSETAGSFLTSAYKNKLAKNAAYDALKNSVYGSKLLSQYSALDLPSAQMEGYRRAGINPVIAFGGLDSSSMPSAASHMASVDAPDIGGIASHAIQRRQLELAAVASAQNQARLEQSIKESKSRIDLNNARTESELELPSKIKKEVDVLNSRITLNNKLRDLYDSTMALHSAQKQDLESRTKFRPVQMLNQSYLGIPGLHLGLGHIVQTIVGGNSSKPQHIYPVEPVKVDD